MIKTSYRVEVLDANNEQDVLQTARVLAETFAGVQVGDSYIKEPMVTCLELKVDDFALFTTEYIKNIAGQGLCTIAKDPLTGEVVAALATEEFDPEEVTPVFDGPIAPMNEIINILMELDVRLFEAIVEKRGSIQKGEYAHPFMCGVKAEHGKRYVAQELFEKMAEVAAQKGYKAIFGEVTSFSSSKLMLDLLGYCLPNGVHGQPITVKYADHEMFRNIPEHIAVECHLVYKALDPEYQM